MHPMTHSETRVALHTRPDGEPSVGDLVTRLAHEGKELAALEVRRLRLEMRDQARRAASTAAAGYIAIEMIALAMLGLGVAIFFVLVDWWGNYAAAAFATSGLLAVAAIVCALVVRGMTKKMFGAFHDELEEIKRDGRAIRGD